MNWIHTLQERNITLFWFGLLCLAGALICLVLTRTSSTQLLGISAWIKPLKFFFSIWIFCWTMGWLLGELKNPTGLTTYSWMVVIVMIIEITVITWQAANGRLSHFNTSTPLYSSLFTIMGIAISILTLWTLVVGLKFFGPAAAHIPPGYLWGIRLGIIIFVIFAFEGGLMGARLAHTVGAADGGAGIQVLNWSKKYGDLRVAHFFGMHALQLLPLIGFYLSRSARATILIALIYFLLTSILLIQALRGLPLSRQTS